MANELLVGVKIGAALSGTFQATFATAQGTLGRLGQSAEMLKARHARMGEVMARALAHPMRNVGALRQEYQRLGATIDQVKVRQDLLAASIARGAALKQQRAGLRSDAMEVAGTAVALGAPVVQSVRLAASHQDRMRDIAITGDFSAAEEAQVGAAVRKSALDWNQTQAQVAEGVSKLVAGGIQSARELAAYAPVIAKTATATRASMEDLGSVGLALKDNLNIAADGFEGAMNMLAYAGKRGQFEIKDMAKWVPALAPSFQALGVTGKDAVAEIGAALQIARKGAGTNDEAANNFKNFLQKITSPDTLKDFSKAGIDLQKSMLTLRAQGMTPVQAMLGTITAYMGSKGPKAAAEFEKAMGLKDDKERQAALQRMTEAYALGELFQDMQAMNFIRPAIANAAEMKSIQNDSREAANKDVIDADFRKRMDTATSQFGKFKIGLADVGITIGDALLPPLVEALVAVRPLVQSFGEWAKANPGVVKGVIGLVGGLLAGKLAILGLMYSANLALAPFVAIGTAASSIAGKWLVLRTLLQSGRVATVISVMRGFGGVMLWAGRVLAGGLLTGLRLAAQAVFILGRAMLLNPIGLAITAIAIGAYLVYRHWGTIRTAFLGAWAWLKGLRARFFDAGTELIAGLVGGISAKLGAAWDVVLGLGASIKGWFTSTLGIKSPSRVFAGFGDNIAQGAALGIERTAPMAARAVTSMAMAAAAAGAHAQVPVLAVAAPRMLSPAVEVLRGSQPPLLPLLPQPAESGRPDARQPQTGPQQALAARVQAAHRDSRATPAPGAANAAGGAGMTIHFSPQITVAGGGPGTKEAVVDALQLTLPELERLIQRVMADKDRRSN